MKCFTTDGVSFEGLKFEERPEPTELGPDDVLVDVKSVSLNYRDLLVTTGRYGKKPEKSFIVASDMAGIVSRVGSQVKEFKPGDQVLNAPFRFWPGGSLRPEWVKSFVGGGGIDGVLAEKIIYPKYSLVKVPAHLNFHEACTFTIAGLTAWAGLVTHGKILPGEWVLIHGTGGVSTFACMIAQKLGAQVIVTSSSEEKARFVKENYGVKASVDYRDPEWPEQVKKISEGGVHVVIELGGDSLGNSIRACRSYARISLIGVLGGFDSKIDTKEVHRLQMTIKGIYMESTEELRHFMQAVEVWQLRPCIAKVFDFEEAKEAYHYLQSQKHIGKVVISVAK